MGQTRTVSAMALALSASACSGTDTGNPPVIDFHNSGCKSQQTSGLVLQSLDAPQLSSADRYAGLSCFAWERLAVDTVRIDVINYVAGCHEDSGWRPRAELGPDDTLELVLQDSDCIKAGCGWCIYDLSFTVRLDQPLTDRKVQLRQSGCGAESERGESAWLALAGQSSGAVCRYAHSVALDDQSFSASPTDPSSGPGSLRMPCGQRGSEQTSCQPELSCVDVGESSGGPFSGGNRCLATCQGDADCDALSRCEASVCKLSASGLTAD